MKHLTKSYKIDKILFYSNLSYNYKILKHLVRPYKILLRFFSGELIDGNIYDVHVENSVHGSVMIVLGTVMSPFYVPEKSLLKTSES